MTTKQILIITILAVLVLSVIVFGFFFQEEEVPEEVVIQEEPTIEDVLQEEGVEYTPEIPEEVTTTTPAKNEAPASSNPTLGTKIRFYDLRATEDGFEPSQLSVISGDSVNIEFTAVDGDYDLDFPYLGAYFSVTNEGEVRTLPFDTSIPGTFQFSCRDHCGGGEKILGTLVVLPRE